MTAFPLAAGDPASRRQSAASLTCADIVDALGRGTVTVPTSGI